LRPERGSGNGEKKKKAPRKKRGFGWAKPPLKTPFNQGRRETKKGPGRAEGRGKAGPHKRIKSY